MDNAEKIIRVIRSERGTAELVDVLAGTTIEPKELIAEVDTLRQRGLVEINSDALTEMRAFLETDKAFTTKGSSLADKRTAAFGYMVEPGRLGNKFVISLPGFRPSPT